MRHFNLKVQSFRLSQQAQNEIHKASSLNKTCKIHLEKIFTHPWSDSNRVHPVINALTRSSTTMKNVTSHRNTQA